MVPINPQLNRPYPGPTKDKDGTITPGSFHQATDNPAKIKKWWRQWPKAWVGSATGGAYLSEAHNDGDTFGLGHTVLDVECKNGVDGITWLDQNYPEWKNSTSAIAKTPHGFHLHFAGDFSIRNGNLAPGVEIKSNNLGVTMPPSPGYYWLNGWPDFAELPELPPGLRPPPRKPRQSRPTNNVAENPARVLTALAVIDPDIGYKAWFEIGCALYKVFGDEEGFIHFNEWSSKGKKYENSKMPIEKQWDAIVANEGYEYTVATIFHFAKEADPLWEQTVLNRLMQQARADRDKVLAHIQAEERAGRAIGVTQPVAPAKQSAPENETVSEPPPAPKANGAAPARAEPPAKVSVPVVPSEQLHDEEHAVAPPFSEEAFAAQLADGGVSLDDFHAYMPQHNFIFVPSREPWPASSVNARIPPVPVFDAGGKAVLDEKGKQVKIKASAWLDQNRPVEQMTWAPGHPMLIRDRLVSEGGWITRQGVTCFNLYRPPTIEPGDASKADPWREHVHKVFDGDGDAEHIIKWLAHRVQRPQEKINHALVFGSKKQGTGKDTLLEPVKHAIGPWNFQEVSPQQVLGRFNGFLKRVIMRVNEARDLGDVNRYQFYDHMKAYTAAPPDVLRVDEKNLREHSIFNCVGVILTTNHKTDGIYLPAEDRRHFVAWSNRTPEDFEEGYWNKLWRWYDDGGNRHVAAYLAGIDISTFDPKAPPPKTAAFWDIVEANRAPEDAELADVLDKLGNPDATTLGRIRNKVQDENFNRWLADRRNSRAIPHRLEMCGYVAIRNDTNDRGFWIVDGRRQVVYAKATLSIREQMQAASKLSSSKEPL